MKHNTIELIKIYAELDSKLYSLYKTLSSSSSTPKHLKNMWKTLSKKIQDRKNYWAYLKNMKYGMETLAYNYTEELQDISHSISELIYNIETLPIESIFEKTIMIEFQILSSPLQRLFYIHDIILSENVYNPRNSYEKYLNIITKQASNIYKHDAFKLLLINSLLKIRREKANLIKKSSFDILTGTRRREYFYENSRFLLKTALRTKKPVAILMIDINDFKIINDKYGHILGDSVLKEIGKALTSTLRDTDIVARFGGDEFIALLYNQGEDGIKSLLNRIKDRIKKIKVKTELGILIKVSLSYGYAISCDNQIKSLSKLIALADTDMYQNKLEHKKRKASN